MQYCDIKLILGNSHSFDHSSAEAGRPRVSGWLKTVVPDLASLVPMSTQENV